MTGIGPGTYTIVETSAPTSYQKPTGAMTLTVAENGTVSLTNYAGTTAAPTVKDATIYVEVTDVKMADLPQTGGAGTPALQLLGVIALAAGVVLIGRRFYGERSK